MTRKNWLPGAKTKICFRYIKIVESESLKEYRLIRRFTPLRAFKYKLRQKTKSNKKLLYRKIPYIKNIFMEINGDKITEEQLEALYIYLSFAFDTMDKDEQLFWIELMKNIDKEFTEV